MEFHSHLKQKYENRDADIVYSVLTKKGNMEVWMFLLIIQQEKSLKSRSEYGALGMGTVFVVLIFISFIIYLLGYIPKLDTGDVGK